MGENQKVSFIEFEAMSTRLERTIRRLWISSILLFIALMGSNAAWIAHSMR